jgi:putative transposase
VGGPFRKSRSADEEIIGIVKELESGATWAEVMQRHGISKETLGRWCLKYHGVGLAEAKRLKALEEENGRLKKLVAD